MKSYKDLPEQLISEIREEIISEIREKHVKELEVIYQDAMDCREEIEFKLSKYRKLSDGLRALKAQKKKRDIAYRRDVAEIVDKMIELETEINFDKKSLPDITDAYSKFKPNKSLDYGKIFKLPSPEEDSDEESFDEESPATEGYPAYPIANVKNPISLTNLKNSMSCYTNKYMDAKKPISKPSPFESDGYKDNGDEMFLATDS